MSELDIERLDDKMVRVRGGYWVSDKTAAAIIAALEDRKRLRAVVEAAEKLDASRDLAEPRLRDIIPLLDELSDALAKYRESRDG